MFKRKSVFLVIYFVIIIMCSLIHLPVIQNILLIIASFILNLIMYYKLNIKSNKYRYACFFIIAINIILIYLKYYNSVSIGFSDGLPYGQVGNTLYMDSHGYYYQSIALGDLWLSGGVKDWITGNIPKNYVERGIYNYFIVFNSLIRYLFDKDLITWMIIKYQFSIMSLALMYKISTNFVKEKYAVIALIIFNFYPGYLLVNTDLLRDNLISFFVILASYLVIKCKNDKKIQWLKILIVLCIITYLRIYIGLILALSLFTYLFIDKLNIKKIISYSIVLFILIFILGKVMEFLGYGFLGLNLLQSGDIESIQWNSESVNTPIKLLIRSFYFVYTGGRTTIDSNCNYILGLYNSIAPIFIAIISLPTIFALILLKSFNKEARKFIIFSSMYSILAGIIITYGFSAIIPRLYICWFWTQCIVFSILISNMGKIKKGKKLLLNTEYMLYILVIAVAFTKWNL